MITGADLLDAPVRWVHVIELAEAAHLLRGGELVLSTGIALPPDAAGPGQVRGRACRGRSQRAGRRARLPVRPQLPRALVAGRRDHKLPLIVLERETQFIAITEAVHAQILDAQVAELRAAQRLHQVFTDLAVAGAAADEIVSQAATRPAARSSWPTWRTGYWPALRSARSGGPARRFRGRSRAVRLPARTGYDPTAGWLVTASAPAARTGAG